MDSTMYGYESITSSIGSGVVSGLITSFIIFLALGYKRNVIDKYFENLLYKDVCIEGNWNVEGTFYDGKTAKRKLKMERVGNRIEGVLSSTQGHDEGDIWDINGEVRNTIITATYASQNKSSLDRGTFTLMIKDNGLKLEGICALYSNKVHAVKYAEFICTKDKSA